jgi:hypothetical protein
MANYDPSPTRRWVLAGALVAPWLPRHALAAPRALAFTVLRNGDKIGEHHVDFTGDGEALSATTDAEMTVRLGPVPVFRYRHHAVETDRGDAFATLEARSVSNGRREHVVAERTAAGVTVDGPGGRQMLARDAGPLNHWNPRNFGGPLFNPETGRLMKVSVVRVGARRWRLSGEVDMEDIYDEAGAWSGASARGSDGSLIEYRRL